MALQSGAAGSGAAAQLQGASSVGAVAAGAASTAGAASNIAASAAAIASAVGGVGGLVVPSSGSSGSSSGGSSLNVGALVGGLIGGIAAFLLLILAAICLLRRRRRKEAQTERDYSAWDGRTDGTAFTGLSTDRVHGSRVDEGAFPSTEPTRGSYLDMDEVHISAPPASRPAPPLSYMQPGETVVPPAAVGAGSRAAAFRRGHLSQGSDEPLLTSPARAPPSLEDRMAAYDARPSLRAPQHPPANRLSDGSAGSDPFRP